MHKETSSVPAIKRLIRGIKGIPVVGTTASKLARLPVFSPARRLAFPGSAAFWDARYREGGTSGKGSYGRLAEFKAEILNDFVRAKHIGSVIELGCGDGAQLSLAEYPEYLGVDVSEVSVQRCRALFASDQTKRFYLKSALPADLKMFDLAISLDVIYHLVEDDVFESHMRELFRSSKSSRCNLCQQLRGVDDGGSARTASQIYKMGGRKRQGLEGKPGDSEPLPV
jgi:SAM-dependent methyltransferase